MLLILCGDSLRMVNDQHIGRQFPPFQFRPELLLRDRRQGTAEHDLGFYGGRHFLAPGFLRGR
jgi:hypothetical protein